MVEKDLVLCNTGLNPLLKLFGQLFRLEQFARCYFCFHKSCFSKVIKPKAVNAKINPTATIAVF